MSSQRGSNWISGQTISELGSVHHESQHSEDVTAGSGDCMLSHSSAEVMGGKEANLGKRNSHSMASGSRQRD